MGNTTTDATLLVESARVKSMGSSPMQNSAKVAAMKSEKVPTEKKEVEAGLLTSLWRYAYGDAKPVGGESKPGSTGGQPCCASAEVREVCSGVPPKREANRQNGKEAEVAHEGAGEECGGTEDPSDDVEEECESEATASAVEDPPVQQTKFPQKTEDELEDLLMKSLDQLYDSAIESLKKMGYPHVKIRRVLRDYGKCYGDKDAFSNIICNATEYLNSEDMGNDEEVLAEDKEKGGERGAQLEEADRFFWECIDSLKREGLSRMVKTIQEVKPGLGRGDALWELLLADLDVAKALSEDTKDLRVSQSVERTLSLKEAAPAIVAISAATSAASASKDPVPSASIGPAPCSPRSIAGASTSSKSPRSKRRMTSSSSSGSAQSASPSNQQAPHMYAIPPRQTQQAKPKAAMAKGKQPVQGGFPSPALPATSASASPANGCSHLPSPLPLPEAVAAANGAANGVPSSSHARSQLPPTGKSKSGREGGARGQGTGTGKVRTKGAGSLAEKEKEREREAAWAGTSRATGPSGNSNSGSTGQRVNGSSNGGSSSSSSGLSGQGSNLGTTLSNVGAMFGIGGKFEVPGLGSIKEFSPDERLELLPWNGGEVWEEVTFSSMSGKEFLEIAASLPPFVQISPLVLKKWLEHVELRMGDIQKEARNLANPEEGNDGSGGAAVDSSMAIQLPSTSLAAGAITTAPRESLGGSGGGPGAGGPLLGVEVRELLMQIRQHASRLSGTAFDADLDASVEGLMRSSEGWIRMFEQTRPSGVENKEMVTVLLQTLKEMLRRVEGGGGIALDLSLGSDKVSTFSSSAASLMAADMLLSTGLCGKAEARGASGESSPDVSVSLGAGHTTLPAAVVPVSGKVVLGSSHPAPAVGTGVAGLLEGSSAPVAPSPVRGGAGLQDLLAMPPEPATSASGAAGVAASKATTSAAVGDFGRLAGMLEKLQGLLGSEAVLGEVSGGAGVGVGGDEVREEAKGGAGEVGPNQVDRILRKLDALGILNAEVMERCLRIAEMMRLLEEQMDERRNLSALERRIRELEVELKASVSWTHDKVAQAARRLAKDLQELRALRAEKEDVARWKRDLHSLEETTSKKVGDLEAQLRKVGNESAELQKKFKHLQAELGIAKAEMQAARLGADETVREKEEMEKREKKLVKKLASMESQRKKAADDLQEERKRAAALDRDLAQAKERQQQAEVRWRQEEKLKEEAVAKFEAEKRSREQAEGSAKRREESIRRKAEADAARHREQVQVLEREVTQLRLAADGALLSSSTGATAQQRWGPGGPPASEQAAIIQALQSNNSRLQRDLNELQEKLQEASRREVRRDRECVMCMSEEICVLFLPCAHEVVCSACNDRHLKQGMKECPSCRTLIHQRIRVYGSS